MSIQEQPPPQSLPKSHWLARSFWWTTPHTLHFHLPLVLCEAYEIAEGDDLRLGYRDGIRSDDPVFALFLDWPDEELPGDDSWTVCDVGNSGDSLGGTVPAGIRHIHDIDDSDSYHMTHHVEDGQHRLDINLMED